jgi:hypothetical protein
MNRMRSVIACLRLVIRLVRLLPLGGFTFSVLIACKFNEDAH